MRHSFQHAVQQTSGLEGAFHPGLQALLEIDRNRIQCVETRRIAGSVNLDIALSEHRPNEPRWDYGIGLCDTHADRIAWVEVHPASSQHVKEVLDKQAWLKRWLTDSAPLLKQMPAKFIWIASGKVSLQSNSPQRRRLAKAGIQFAGRRYNL